MNKLFKVTNIELRPGREGDFVMICLFDYTPDVEKVDAQKEKLERFKQSLPEDARKAIGPIFDAFGAFGAELPNMGGGLQLRHEGHKETAMVILTFHEYEEMGSPAVGQLLKVDLALGKDKIGRRPS